MGCSISNIDENYYSDIDSADFAKIGLTSKEIHRYLVIFKRFDHENCLQIKLADFLQDSHLELNYLVTRLFQTMDTHQHNSLNFREVILS